MQESLDTIYFLFPIRRRLLFSLFVRGSRAITLTPSYTIKITSLFREVYIGRLTLLLRNVWDYKFRKDEEQATILATLKHNYGVYTYLIKQINIQSVISTNRELRVIW